MTKPLPQTEGAQWLTSAFSADKLAEKVERGMTWRRSGNLAQFDVEGDAALAELCRRLNTAEDALEKAEEDSDERVARLRTVATDTRLRDAQSVAQLLDDACEALQSAQEELERAEEHHRWHHEQEQREVESDDERLRVLMVIAEALDSLGCADSAALRSPNPNHTT